ncbi:MAG: ATPase [Clostridia bacterium]|nr:ATPase [Clostridia bacterium]
MTDHRTAIAAGQTALGIEFGSTRVKAVLVSKTAAVLAEGVYDWENRYEDGYWTYRESDIFAALQGSFAALKENVKRRYDLTLTTVGAIGVSGMMHGYLALDENDRLLVPFRTWRNTTCAEAAAALTEAFGFNIPERWSIAHLYQAILNGEAHCERIAHLTTLAGLIHYYLTGRRVVGVGEASGMFPIGSDKTDYDKAMLGTFDTLTKEKAFPWSLRGLLPDVLSAGQAAGTLTARGAKLLDPSGDLQPGIPFCPPEGDAGTGMTATNSVRVRTGNVSAGTSVFAMFVLEQPLSAVYPEIDLVTTPCGDPVAMVHCNNCTADIDTWGALLCSFTEAAGMPMRKGAVLDLIYNMALSGAPDCDGLVSFNYLSGESITKTPEGVPLLLRARDSRPDFAAFARNLLSGALCTLRAGYDLLRREQVQTDVFYGHGGFFKAKTAGQTMMANALDVPVTVMETADVGGPWGMAILALYLTEGGGLSLPDFLDQKIFCGAKQSTVFPDREGKDGFDAYYQRFLRALPLEQAAAKQML